MWVDVYVWGKGVIDIFGYHDDRNLLSMVNENVSHRCMSHGCTFHLLTSSRECNGQRYRILQNF